MDLMRDVEIPADAQAVHMSDKSKADRLILSNPRPIEFVDRKTCLEAVRLCGLSLQFVTEHYDLCGTDTRN